MKRRVNLPLLTWILLLALMFGSMSLAGAMQSDFGNVEVTQSAFNDNGIQTTYKLYRPVSATEANPAPAVLLMHGYQNDKDTSAPYALELARRGIVALSVDAYGHGGSSEGMLLRGYTKHKLPNWEDAIGGPKHFLLMMNFNTCDFFTNLIDVPGDTLGDTSMGGRAMYAYLRSLPFVKNDDIGIAGHSMGTWSSWSVAAEYPEHKAIVLQCGELFPKSYYDSERIPFNNVLLLQARYEEFSCFLDYTKAVPDALVNTKLRYEEFANQSAPIEWDKTYGAFEDGSARRMELIRNANHRLVTINKTAIAAAMDWFTSAFNMNPSIPSHNQNALLLETLKFIGLLCALLSILPLLLLLLKTKYFCVCAQRMPVCEALIEPNRKWWKRALVAMLISGLTYPFITQLGHGLVPFPESIFRMTIGNGIFTWFLLLLIIVGLMLIRWYKHGKGKKAGATLYCLGLANEEAPTKLPLLIVGKSMLLAVILAFSVYIYSEVFMRLFAIDFRFVWPLLKPFTGERFLQFLIYLPIYFAYFLVAGGIRLYGQMRQKELKNNARTQLCWWLKSSLVMVGGLILICLIEYIPYFMGIGPGMDLLFTSTFGGPFISYLIVIIPQFVLLFFLATYVFRKTGYVYIGSALVAILGAWAVAGGSSIL